MSPLHLPLDVGPPGAWVAAHGLPIHATLWDAAGDHRLARFAALAVDPVEVLSLGPDHPAPFEALDALRARAAHPAWSALPPPRPLVAALLSYDLGRHVERVATLARADSPLPELWAARYDAAYVWDRHTQAGRVLATDAAAAERLTDRLTRPAPTAPDPGRYTSPQAETHRAAYGAAFDRLQRHLRDGDVYQVNLTVRFRADVRTPGDPGALFHRLHARSPVPFALAARVDPGHAVLCQSPERFLAWRPDGHVETRPIKGTRPRGASLDVDAALRAELIASPKDHAEHIMIVDLERNDLGRVCQVGSVRVPHLMRAEAFATVHHLVSVVEGRLRPEVTLPELLRATFPGGSITGAPKARAMEIIEALEPTRRGLYCGAAGYLDPAGGGDLNLVIRTAVLTPQTIFYQAGGGIVVDSEADAEWAELHDKAAAFLAALPR